MKNMKRMKRILIALLVAVLLIQTTQLCSCQKGTDKFTTYSFEYFDTVTTITGYAASQEEFDQITNELLEELGEYHRLYTIYHRFDGMENLCTINETVDGVHRVVAVDQRIIDMLMYARDMYDLTEGRVNIAMGSVLSLWHEYRQLGIGDPSSAELPPMDQLLAASAHTDIDCMVIDQTQNTVTLTDPDMTLDVGAIAKGYAVEMAARWLIDRGLNGYMINIGGNVRTVGAKGDGQGWTIGIRNPDQEATDYLAYLTLESGSLVTSGSYQRYYEVDGKQYHHIIDQNTLMPADYHISVSVLCESSALGDALSTALFCMPLEKGQELVESMEGVEALWVASDGTMYRSQGFPK